MVYWELRRRGFSVSYDVVGTKKHEVDFVAGEPAKPPHLAIQVCMDLSDPDVVEREVWAFRQIKERLGPQIEPLIVTLDSPPAHLSLPVPVTRGWEWALQQTTA